MKELPFLPLPLPEPGSDMAERIVTIISAAFADDGWYGRHQLIRLVSGPERPSERTRGSSSQDIEFGFLELDEKEHPLRAVVGLRAPADWWAVGLVTYGWAAKIDGDLDAVRGTYRGRRPSQAPDRVRVRSVLLVTRDGDVASTSHFEDGKVIDESGVGMVLDCLRRVVAVPTEAPGCGTEHLWASLWLQQIIGLSEEGGRRLSWRQAASCHPAQRLLATGGSKPPQPDALLESGAALARTLPWGELRGMVAEGLLRWAVRTMPPDVAGWCDDGLFARLILSEMPPMSELLFLLRRAVTASTGRQINELLESWGVLTDAEPSEAVAA